MSTNKSVLFVCLGNICRSPMAEGAFRVASAQIGLDPVVDSAGIGNWHEGQAPDPRACETAKRNGIDISGRIARQIRDKDFYHFDLIVAVDREIFDDLKRLAPLGSSAHVGLLLDYLPGYEGQSVADPYYGSEREFDIAWKLLERGTLSLAKRIQSGALDLEPEGELVAAR